MALRGETRVSAAQFRRDVAALAALLPSKPFLVNLCQDRYRFMVGFAAALMRGQVTLMPSANTPGILKDLAEDYADLYALTDTAPPDLPHLLFLETLPEAEAADLLVPGDQPAVVLFTSGSTGRPKPVAKTWATLVASARVAGERLNATDFQAGCVIGTVPHQHSYGLESIILLAWQYGLAVLAACPLFPADVRAALEAAPEPRLLVTTPVHLRALMADPGGMPGAGLILSATAPLPIDLAQRAEACFGAPLMEIYGCTEAGQIATRRSTQESDWHCFENVVLHEDATGWWASGAAVEGIAPVQDVIEPVAPGRFRLGSRSADLVNIAGKRSSISYLTHQLLSIPGVEDGTFLMEEGAGQAVPRLKALVVAPSLSTDRIMQALRVTLEPAFLPRPLIRVATLPRNHLGKLLRADVLALAAAEAAE
ncbi:MAG TPA: AMP-binding protein [Acidisoma sp.]|uniref:AMP-binding protein n=1 Tax=Acidisoma sp. TaxID=1872115 RepID=UPI002BBB2D87|nr:AMP-binding protein [Acidisoma sp.]HTH99631.1 AMP-binding protein [Acidisoma sp.]